MKILIASESYYPNISGVAVFSHNLAKKMVEKGHRVYVIAPSPKFTPYEEMCDGVKIYRLPSKINRYRHGFYISKSPNRKVQKILREIHPDIIHLQDPAMICFSALIEAKKQNIPIVITNHFFLEYVVSYLPYLKPIHFIILFILTHYLNWFYAKADVLTCPTKTIAEHFIKTGIKIKVEVISNGVDLSRFMPYYGDSDLVCQKFNIPYKLPLILYVGRLDAEKNVIQIVKAAPEVENKCKAHFVILGSGKEKEKLIALCEQLGVRNNFTFIDFIPYEDRMLPLIYQASSIFVNPCPIETQSIVTLEASATGLPIVGANSGALVELIENGVNGYRFESENPEDLAQKIISILEKPSLAKKMGEKSVEIVEEHLVEDTFNKFEEIYIGLKR